LRYLLPGVAQHLITGGAQHELTALIALVLTAGFVGLRPGELAALDWSVGNAELMVGDGGFDTPACPAP
jgi:hypothetical protein